MRRDHVLYTCREPQSGFSNDRVFEGREHPRLAVPRRPAVFCWVKRLVNLASVALLLVATGAPAQLNIPAPGYVISAAASSAGLGGTYFRTDISLQNPNPDTSIRVVVGLSKRGADNSSPEQREFRIPPMGSIFLPDILLNTFGYMGTGSLVLLCPEGDVFLAFARTYTASEKGPGTYGLGGLGELSAGMENMRLFVPGLQQGGGTRTNTGVFNIGSEAADFLFEIFGPDGTRLASRQVPNVPAKSSIQIALSDFSPSFTSGLGVWTCLSPGKRTFSAYATGIDNDSGDSVYVPGVIDLFQLWRKPALQLTGRWRGRSVTSAGTAEYLVDITQTGALVSATLHENAATFQFARVSGWEDQARVELTGESTALACKDQGTTLALSLSGTSGRLTGTASGTGCYTLPASVTLERIP